MKAAAIKIEKGDLFVFDRFHWYDGTFIMEGDGDIRSQCDVRPPRMASFTSYYLLFRTEPRNTYYCHTAVSFCSN